jgi:hypothetical protein
MELFIQSYWRRFSERARKQTGMQRSVRRDGSIIEPEEYSPQCGPQPACEAVGVR